MTVIEVNGIKVYGYHGCMTEESVIGTWFEVDVALGYDFTKSAETDDLSDTIDYVRVKEIVEESVLKRSNLIETVIKNMADSIKSEYDLEFLRIKLTKHNPPINGNVSNVAVVWQE